MRYLLLFLILGGSVYNGEFKDFETCMCHSAAKTTQLYCGFEILNSNSDPNCLANAIYQCVNGSNTQAHRYKYCIDSPCIRKYPENHAICYRDTKYREDFAKGAAPKCEGCFLGKDGSTYADHKYYTHGAFTFGSGKAVWVLHQKVGKNWTATIADQ